MLKRFIIVATAAIVSCFFSLKAEAQPRAAGIRLGVTGFEASYQHAFGKDFLEAGAGIDFGYGGAGFKATGIYNFVFARPAWSDRGSWGLYAGPGLSLGYVSDRCTTTSPWTDYYGVTHTNKRHFADSGFMFAFTGQAGLEYTFWFPLQLSVDIRPYFGFHTSSSGTGFYNYGMMGFVPTLSARYRF